MNPEELEKVALGALAGRVPETRGELMAMLDIACDRCGVPRLPRKAACPGHSSPADWVSDLFFAESRNAVIHGARGTCKTLGMSLLAAALMLKGREEVRMLGGSAEQSRAAHRYLSRLFVIGLPEWLETQPTLEQIRLKNGSEGLILKHSHTSVRGHHPSVLIGDELDEWDPSIFQAFLGQAQRAGRLLALTSTSHRPGGLMGRLLKRAAGEGFAVHTTCLFEVMHCDRDDCSECRAAVKTGPNGQKCSFFDLCAGETERPKAKVADGFIRVEEALDMFRMMDWRTAMAELFCKGAKAEGLVFPAFDPAVHVRELALDPALPVYQAFDFGYENPSVCLTLQADREDRLLVVDELYARRISPSMFAAKVRQRRAAMALEGRVAHAWGDPSGAAQMSELRRAGIFVAPARMTAEAVGKDPKETSGGFQASLAHLSRLFEPREDGTPGVLIGSRCTELIDELGSYRFKPGRDEVLKENDHGPDALRYAAWMLRRARPQLRDAEITPPKKDRKPQVGNTRGRSGAW